MIPILYPVNQSTFVTNGLGLLSDTVSCKCTEKLNDKYEIELTVPRNGNHTNDIQINCVIKVKPNYEDEPQPFRVYSVEKNYDDNILVKAAHISYDTSGIPILPFTSENLDDAVDNMNNNRLLLNSSKFVLNAEFSAEGTLKVESPTSFRSLLGGSDTSIIGVYKGEYHYDNYVVNLVEKRGADRGICFRYGKNISDFEEETDSQELYTAVVGYWKKSNGNDQEDTVIYGNIIQCEGVFPYDKIYILDTSSLIKNEDNSDATVEQIDEQSEKFIADNAIGLPKTKMKINYAEDANVIHVCLGDRVGIVYPEYSIYAMARCNTVVFDCLAERNESIDIGVDTKDLSDSIAELLAKQ